MILIRRIVSFFLLALILAGIVYGLIWLRAGSLKILSPEKAVPPGVVMFLETHDFRQLSSSVRTHNNIWTEFKSYKALDLLDRDLRMIDSLGRKYPEFGNLTGGSMILSLNHTGGGFRTLFIMSVPHHNGTEQILKLIPSDTEIDKERHESVTVYNVRFKKDGLLPGFFFFESKGLFVMSPSKDLIESSAEQLNSTKGLDQNAEFLRLKGTAGSDVVANLFINYQELGAFVKTIFKDSAAEQLSKFASWSALDLDIKPDYFTLNGFTTAGDSSMRTIRVLQGQKPVSFSFAEVIPSNAVFFSVIGFTDARLMLDHVGKDASNSQRAEKLDDLQKKFSSDFVSEFIPIMDGEAGSVVLKARPGNFDRYFLLRVKGKGMAESVMEKWTGIDAGEKGTDVAGYSGVLNIDSQHQVTVHRSPVQELTGLLFGDFYQGGDYEYFTYSGNYIIFGSSPAALKSFLYSDILGKTLENDEKFSSMKDNISSRSNLFVYFNPSQCIDIISETMVPGAAKVMDSHKNIWRKIDAVAFQSTSTDELNYFRLFCHYSSQVREPVNTVWQSKLDTVALFKPAVVINHLNNQKEIMVQDLRHNLYLISNSGTILWKVKTDGEIISEIFQVDYYRNGKLQYLFNTKSHIYLLDRNGNAVERFPVGMREPASAGLSLFDYDNDGTLRICIPTEDKKIYMFDREGKVIPGWDFPGSDYPVTQPVKHVRIGDKDYIIACDAVRLYILDRKGAIRVSPSKDILHSVRNPVFPVPAAGGQRSRIIATDTSGTVWYFYYDGKVTRLFNPGLSSQHYFVPEDLNGDGKPEFIFADGNKLLVYNEQGKILFKEEYPEPVTWPPIVYEFSARDRKIGVVTARSGRIYLINNDGSLYEGFPLLGVSPFSISSFPGLKDRFNLIVGNNDNFLYNYSVK